MQLTWQNPTSFSSIDVYRDYELVATLDGDAEDYLDAALTPGLYLYVVVGTDGSTVSAPATRFAWAMNPASRLRIFWTQGGPG